MAARKKTTRKKTTKKKTVRKAAKKTVRKTAKKKTARKPASSGRKRISPADGNRTKSDFFATIAENTELSKKQVAEVFDVMGDIIAADLSKRGPQAINIPGMMKITLKRKPATKARKGINPFTKEPTIFKAKPASNQVKIRPLKNLKDMV